MSTTTAEGVKHVHRPKRWHKVVSLWDGAKRAAKRAGSRAKHAAKKMIGAVAGFFHKYAIPFAKESGRRVLRTVAAVAWFVVAVALSIVLGASLVVAGILFQLYFTAKWLVATKASVSLAEYADSMEFSAFAGVFSEADWEDFLRGAAKAEETGHTMPADEFIEDGHVDAEEIDAEPLSTAELIRVALEFGRKVPLDYTEFMPKLTTEDDLVVVYEAAAAYEHEHTNANGFAYWKARSATRAAHGSVDAKKTVSLLYRQSKDFWNSKSAAEGLEDETNLISHKVAA